MKTISFFFIVIFIYSFNVSNAQTSPGKINRLSNKCIAGDVKSCEKLIKIAKYDKSSYSRYNAVGKITDQTILTEIALNEIDSDIIKIAVQKIPDQDILFDIINKSNNYYTRNVAVEKMTDTKLLLKIAKNNSNYKLRNTAVAKLSDNNVLADIVENDKNNIVRIAALKKITDQDILLNIKENHKEYSIRMMAISILKDKEVITNLSDKNAIQNYLLTDIEEIQDQNILLDIAKNGKNFESRLFALNSLNEEEYSKEILYILNENKDTFHNLAAIAALKIIQHDKILSNYYKSISFSIEFENLKIVENINDWQNIKYNILLMKSISYDGRRNITLQSISFNKFVYNEIINIYEIYEDILSVVSDDDIKKIQQESSNSFLLESTELFNKDN